MEDIITDCFVDCLSQEVLDIQSAVVELLQNYKYSNNVKREIFNIKQFELCGSMAELTRTWSFDIKSYESDTTQNEREPVLEFDFLAILSKNSDLVLSEDQSCYGHKTIFKRSPKGEWNTLHREFGVYLSPQDVADRFQSELVYSVAASCDCKTAIHHRGKGLGLRNNVGKRTKACTKCTVQKKTGCLSVATYTEFGHPYERQCNLIFKWTSTSKTISAKDVEIGESTTCTLDHIFILVDVLPAYILHDTKSKLSNTGLRRLIPKPCKACDHSLCWRISFSRIETDTVLTASELHRHVYMTLKILVAIAFPKSVFSYLTIPSYILKTAFLQHIGNCYHQGTDFIDCLSTILHLLSISFEQEELNNYFTHYNLLDRYDHLGPQFYHERRECFKIIQHFVKLSELTENFSLDSMQPYLSQTKHIYDNLQMKNETLESHLFQSTNRDRDSIRTFASSFRLSRQESERRKRVDIPEQDRSNYEGSVGGDTATINHTIHSSVHSRHSEDTRRTADIDSDSETDSDSEDGVRSNSSSSRASSREGSHEGMEDPSINESDTTMNYYPSSGLIRQKRRSKRVIVNVLNVDYWTPPVVDNRKHGSISGQDPSFRDKESSDLPVGIQEHSFVYGPEIPVTFRYISDRNYVRELSNSDQETNEMAGSLCLWSCLCKR